MKNEVRVNINAVVFNAVESGVTHGLGRLALLIEREKRRAPLRMDYPRPMGTYDDVWEDVTAYVLRAVAESDGVDEIVAEVMSHLALVLNLE